MVASELGNIILHLFRYKESIVSKASKGFWAFKVLKQRPTGVPNPHSNHLVDNSTLTVHH